MKRLPSSGLLTRLIKVGKPFWVSEQCAQSRHLLLSVLGLLSTVSALSVLTNYAAGRFMTAIQAKDLTSYYYLLACYALALSLAAPAANYYGYLRTKLALTWRQWLLMHFATRDSFVQVLQMHLRPQQRGQLGQDVDTFCNMAVGLTISLLDALITIATFSVVLWTISATLMKAVFCYSLLGCIITYWIGNRLVALNQEHIVLETNMRYVLTELNARDGDIATEHRCVTEVLKSLNGCIQNAQSMMFLNRTLGFFTSGYNMLVAIIPAAVAAPLYFQGQMEFGDIVRAGMAFTQVFGGMTLLINQFNPISAFAATVDRLGSFLEALEQADRATASPS